MTKLKQQIKKTALYYRLSRDDEYSGDSVSIQTKKTMLSQFTKERGFTNCEYFVDDGYSGTNFNRPDFQRMLGMVEEGKVGVICVKNLSRLAKTQRKSFRNKRIVHTSENEWLITEDTHEALANQATIEAVQQRIQVKQPRPRLNPENMLRGLMVCGDCNTRMAFASASGRKTCCHCSCEKHKHYGGNECSAHYISVKQINAVTLEDTQKHVRLAAEDKEKYIAYLMQLSEREWVDEKVSCTKEQRKRNSVSGVSPNWISC